MKRCKIDDPEEVASATCKMDDPEEVARANYEINKVNS
jgi:hypothetical protein